MGLRYVSSISNKNKIGADSSFLRPNEAIRTLSYVQKNLLSTTSAMASATNPDNLPHLPLPKLEDTLRKYLASVKPLLTDEKYQQAIQLAEDFRQGQGAKLQALLKEKADNSENWLADWWTTVAYLTFRLSVVTNSNPGHYFATRFLENDFEWCRHAARVSWASLRYKQMIDNGEIQPERAGKALLDMSQYKKIFGTCRVPGRDCDQISFNSQSKHIVVAYRNAVSICSRLIKPPSLIACFNPAL